MDSTAWGDLCNTDSKFSLCVWGKLQMSHKVGRFLVHLVGKRDALG